MKVGVLGGTFDPIHWGHLVLAEEARIEAGLDQILFVPSGHPPHKRAEVIAPFAHRLAMVRLAVGDREAFAVSDIESEGMGPHFTLASLDRLYGQRPDDQISFLLGSDSLLDLPNWRDPLALVARYPLVVLVRPGFNPAAADSRFTGRTTFVSGVQFSVSSTLVRRRLAGGVSVRFLVPPVVEDYIRRHGLYGAPA